MKPFDMIFLIISNTHQVWGGCRVGKEVSLFETMMDDMFLSRYRSRGTTDIAALSFGGLLLHFFFYTPRRLGDVKRHFIGHRTGLDVSKSFWLLIMYIKLVEFPALRVKLSGINLNKNIYENKSVLFLHNWNLILKFFIFIYTEGH